MLFNIKINYMVKACLRHVASGNYMCCDFSDFTIVLTKKFTNQIYEKAATYCCYKYVCAKTSVYI